MTKVSYPTSFGTRPTSHEKNSKASQQPSSLDIPPSKDTVFGTPHDLPCFLHPLHKLVSLTRFAHNSWSEFGITTKQGRLQHSFRQHFKKGFKNLSILYKKKTLNHITIYNVMFSSISNYHPCNPYNMMRSDDNIASWLNYNCNKVFLCCALNLIKNQKPPN